jgi:glycosyltransferase involved in cell wall biosynthesis
MPKVLYIGFGISPFMRGGAIVYQESLIEAVNARGWETTCFFAAPRYTNTIRNKPYLKRWYKDKIKFIELYNSPHLFGHLNDPDQQCYHSEIQNLTQRVLDEEKPDIVHFHELQMHTASIIDIASDRKITSLKTMHNYYDICPQRDLMYKEKELCFDFDNGKRCVECLTILPVHMVPFRKRIARTLLPIWLYKYLSALYNIIKKIGKYKNNQNKTEYNYKIATYYPDRYRCRRHFFIERLNKLDTIHCSTSRSAEIFINYGVLREKIKVIPLSVKNIEKIFPKPLRNNYHPIIFGFIGGMYFHKGCQILIDAFSMLDQSKAKLIIWDAPESNRLNSNLNIELRAPYSFERITQVLKEIDVGIMPSLWEEVFGMVGIEWLTARIPVIGSNIGGIPEWLKDGENGFLVPPGDVQQLAKKMELFVKDPGLVAKIQRQIKPWKTLKEHVDEMITLYENTIASRKL